LKDMIRGKAFVLGDDVDTDQIIPAQHLVFSPAIPEERRMFGKYALSGVPSEASGLPQGGQPFVEECHFQSEYTVLVAGTNFGCGSSREHAPLALQMAGVQAVVAEFYARIFFRNSVNGGYLLPFESEERLCEAVRTGDDVELDVKKNILINHSTGHTYKLKPLGEVLPILEAGDLFAFARAAGMIR
jgi:3-isopropylmalate/(R)-2-methylmalate dehydratase small subunit